jgi:phosphoglycolate phosphatase-like HAD superfamily hydrolase
LAALDSWTDGPTKAAIVDFVGRVTTEDGPDYVAPEERIAVFDNDGTLWCEKPMYIQLDFLIRRFAEQAAADPSLREKQPYKAAVEGDLKWFGEAVAKHYQGDDSYFKPLVAAILTAHHEITVEEHRARVSAFFNEAKHPTLGRPYTACGYRPMVELLRYLEDNGFTNYIVSGGGRDFMRPVTGQLYGIPPERVVGSSVGLDYRDGNLFTTSQPEFLDDGPMKPVRLWSRIGRRPILAAGNSNGDIEMLEFTGGLRLLVLHDDGDREFDYTAGAEKSLDRAATDGWTVVSMRNDWICVFSD